MLILICPILIIVLCISAFIVLCFKRWKTSGFLFLLAIILNIYSECFPLNLFKKNGGQYDLRVAAYNIDCLGWGVKIDGWQEELLTFIDSVDADILFLAEFQYHDFGGYTDLVAAIDSSRFYSECVGKYEGRKDVVYSKYPILSSQRIMINPKFCENEELYREITEEYYQKLHPMIYLLHIDVKGVDVQVVCCHLASNEYNTILLKTKEESNYLKKVPALFSALSTGATYREVEANSIRAELDFSKPIIIMGDMNDIGGSTPLNILKNKKLTDAWWSNGHGYGHTYFHHNMYFRLDHILYSGDFECVNVDVPHCKASDHYPIVADFKINK